MVRLRILYDVPGWAYHNQALALEKYAPPGVEVSMAALPEAEQAAAALGEREVDLVFLLAERKTTAVRELLDRRRWTSRLVVGWSSGGRRREELFETCRAAADAWIFNNRGAWECLAHEDGSSYLIPNGVDLELFAVRREPAQRPPKLLWTGSLQYRQLKGYDDILLPLRPRLERAGIECDLWLVDSRGAGRRTSPEMADWYNQGTVLVCASESEGTPNPALEAAACGCTVVSTAVGNMPELIRDDVNGYLVERTVEAFERAVIRACENYPRLSAQMQEDIRQWHWRERARSFYAVFASVLDRR